MIASLFMAAAALPALEKMVATPATVKRDDIDESRHCSIDRRWCFELSKDVDLNKTSLNVWHDKAQWTYAFNDDTDLAEYELDIARLWPNLIRARTNTQHGIEESAYVGVIIRSSTSYSGGGASVDTLLLFRLSELASSGDKPAFEAMLEVPIRASKMIRACFSEKDMRLRRNACHDLYEFDGTLTVSAQPPATGNPVLIYKTVATAQPNTSRLSNDNSALKRPLTPQQRRKGVDPACTYTRTLRYDAKTKSYGFDKPLPACEDYTSL